MKLLLRIFGVLLIASLVFLLAGLLATWEPDRSVEQLKPRWATPASQFLTVQGLSVHVRDEGPRPDPMPVVLLHGTSASLHTWDGWTEALIDQRRVIRFDLPGFGLTGPRADNDYSIAAYASFVFDVLDQMGVRQFVLVGNSLGGQIAIQAALKQPQRVKKLVLIDSAGYDFEPTSIPIGFQIARIPVLRNIMEYVLPRGVVQSSVRNVYGDPSKVTAALVDRYYDMTLRAGNRKALAFRMQQPRAQGQERIATLKVPTLILWGGQDRLIPPQFGQQFAADIQGSKLVVFDQLGHVPHEEDPDATVIPFKVFLLAP